MFIEKFFDIVQFDATNYISYELPKKVKITKDIVTLNYNLLGNDLFFIQEDSILHIWYVKNKTNVANMFIPEAYLLYKVISEKDGIFAFEFNDHYKVMVIKENKLIDQFTTLDKKSAATFKILSYQYGLPIIGQNESNYNELIKKARKLDHNDINNIIKNFFNFKYKSIDYNKILDNIAKPALVFSLLIALYNFYILNYLEKEYNESVSEYSSLKDQTKDIKGNIELTANKTKDWEIINKVINKGLSIEHYHSIITSLKKTDKLKQLSINSNNIRIKVSTDDSLNILDNINKKRYFRNVKIVASNIDKKIKSNKIIVLEGNIDE